MLPPGFWGVMTCLWEDPSPADAHEAPLGPLQLAAVMESTVATMSASCIVKDETTGVTYMDTMTTSMGRWPSVAPTRGPQPRSPS